jgi:hypothetical protein
MDMVATASMPPIAGSRRGQNLRARLVYMNPVALLLAWLLFDEAHYSGMLGRSLGRPQGFIHFMIRGWRNDSDPTHWFSVSAYLRANPDVAAAGVNPFLHFCAVGRREQRQLTPATADESRGRMLWGGW